jgi:ribosome biogenesis GTPase A
MVMPFDVLMFCRELQAVRTHRAAHRTRRQDAPIPVVALVGYTNAGKSTLLNTMTDAGVLAEDKLFATLDPTTRKVRAYVCFGHIELMVLRYILKSDTWHACMLKLRRLASVLARDSLGVLLHDTPGFIWRLFLCCCSSKPTSVSIRTAHHSAGAAAGWQFVTAVQ